MDAFEKVISNATVFRRKNVDTDVIIPGKYLKTVSRKGLGKGAFETLRFAEDGSLLDSSPFDGQRGQVLIVGENFGCGSSREHAVWALMDLGFRTIIAPSFADIFRTNAVRNGLLLVDLDENVWSDVADKAEKGQAITVDLESRTVMVGDEDPIAFDYPDEARKILLEGLDEIANTLTFEADIAAFEAKQKAEQPWLYSAPPIAAPKTN